MKILRLTLVAVALAAILASTPAALAQGSPTFTVTALSAFLRRAPSTSGEKLYSVFKGTMLPIIGRTADNSWLRVSYTAEETWISAGVGSVTGDLGSVQVMTGSAPAPTPIPAAPGPSPDTSPPASVSSCNESNACFNMYLRPESLRGDFYIDGVLMAAGVTYAQMAGLPDVPHLLEVRNVQEPGAPGFGDVYNYADQNMVLYTKANWSIRGWFYGTKQYLKGTLQYLCDARNAVGGESLACRPTVDGILQPDVVPGQYAPLNLSGGNHVIHTDLVGDAAGSYISVARDDTVYVTAGRTGYFSATFTRKGQFTLTTSPGGLLADFYVDGALVATQAGSATAFVGGGVNHAIEARNITDPAAGGRYTYNNVSAVNAVAAGRTRTVTLRPTKTWLTGTLKVTCIINRKSATDDAQCQVSSDGASLGTVPNNDYRAFSLTNGGHAVSVSVTGGSAGKWDGPVNFNVGIAGATTSYYTARFSLKPSGSSASVSPPASQGSGPVVVASGGTPGTFELGGQVASFGYPDLMRYAGMTWVKRQVRFSPGASADGEGYLITDAHNKGFKILLSVIGTSPEVLRGGANYDEYALFVGRLAALGADAIEVWNEMNLDREWPAGEIDPFKYTDLLKRSYAQIKTSNPNTMVISGAPAPTGAEGAFGLDHVWNDDRYMRGLAAAGAINYMDCLGVHYNEGIISPTQSSGDPRDGYYTRYYSGMINTYLAIMGTSKKICFTELAYISPDGYPPLPSFFGWAGNNSVDEHAQWLAEAASLSRGNGRVRLMIIFNVDFTYYASDDPQAASAIVRPGGGCPACATLHSVMIGN